MRAIADELLRILGRDEPFALATVVGASGAMTVELGTSMAVGRDSLVVGGISAGCIQTAVYDRALQVLTDGVPFRGVFDSADPIENDSVCRTTMHVVIQLVGRGSALPDLVQALVEGREVTWAMGAIEAEGPVGIIVMLSDAVRGTLGRGDLDALVIEEARMMRDGDVCAVRSYRVGEKRISMAEIFVQRFAPRRRLLLFGCTPIVTALARLGRFAGFEVAVCDARAVFTTQTRFPDAGEVTVAWPHEYFAAQAEAQLLGPDAAIVCATQDLKFDLPLLAVALRRTDLSYVGALGSHAMRLERDTRLRQLGLRDTELSKLHSPLGLDLGATGPEEVAISIVGEIVASAYGRSGRPLREVGGPIHGMPSDEAVRDRASEATI